MCTHTCTFSVYTVSQKNVPLLTCYNLYIHGSIVTIFGKNVAEKVAIKMYFIVLPQLTIASALPEETGNLEIASFHLNAACFLPKNTKHCLKNHLVRAEPPTVKTIDWVHRTGPRKGA